MKELNSFRLNFKSRSSNEGFARVSVSAFLSQYDPTLSEIADIKTAVSEAVTNCCVHAYPNEIGDVFLSVKVFEDGVVRIYIRDKGKGIEDIEKAMEPMYTTGDTSERSGLGFTVMQSFCDALSVRSKLSRGTTVILTKKLSNKD
jgi:stage II sporulation protein AB (anti-sigma F factor)